MACRARPAARIVQPSAKTIALGEHVEARPGG
jgi:hypothetical protein